MVSWRQGALVRNEIFQAYCHLCKLPCCLRQRSWSSRQTTHHGIEVPVSVLHRVRPPRKVEVGDLLAVAELTLGSSACRNAETQKRDDIVSVGRPLATGMH